MVAIAKREVIITELKYHDKELIDWVHDEAEEVHDRQNGNATEESYLAGIFQLRGCPTSGREKLKLKLKGRYSEKSVCVEEATVWYLLEFTKNNKGISWNLAKMSEGEAEALVRAYLRDPVGRREERERRRRVQEEAYAHQHGKEVSDYNFLYLD